MSHHFYRYTSTNPYLHQRMTELENEQRDRALLRRATLGPVGGARRSLRLHLAISLRTWADRLEAPTLPEVQSQGCEPGR